MEASSQPTGKGSSRLAIALAVVALVLSIAALGLTYAKPSGVAPRTLAITVTIDEGLVVTGYNSTCQCAVEIDSNEADTEKVVGEYVRWAPNVIIIPGARTVEHARDSLTADALALSPGELDAIDRAEFSRA